MNFGIRVLNDDNIAPERGFGTHPHDNMEIITIPLEGDLKHKDNMGNGTVIKNGDIQVMSAGIGITHSEFNANKDSHCKLLQIWLFQIKKMLLLDMIKFLSTVCQKKINYIRFYRQIKTIKEFGFTKMLGFILVNMILKQKINIHLIKKQRKWNWTYL